MAFVYKLEHDDGTPADPPTANGGTELASRRHDPARPARTLRVIEVRDDADGPVLVVERPPRGL
jgi:hypothetical protein